MAVGQHKTSRRNHLVDPSAEEDRILRRGLEAFAELGYAATTVRLLAERIGVSHNFINDRYGSKLHFWKASIDAELQDKFKILEDLRNSGVPDEERLVAVVRAFYDLAAQSPEVNRIVADESTRDSERLDHLYEKYILPFCSDILPVIHRLMNEGRMPELSNEAILFALTGPALATAQAPLARRIEQLPHAPRSKRRSADSLADFVLRGLLVGEVSSEIFRTSAQLPTK